MTNLEKMNELVGSNANKDQIIRWAYMNRIHVVELPLEEEFECMQQSVDTFCESEDFQNYIDDEFKLWEKFLEAKYVGN
ncbi:Uncharacterised protein [[Flavobacterium] thermophilum]|nr:Uncharacterised protein [[Flavobacterium] thermophilum]